MRPFVLMMFISFASSNAAAAFVCESIKEKATRDLCIEDRVAKGKEEAVSEANKKELSEFVGKAKAALTWNFKDPASAQFTNLVVSEGRNGTTLCGLVNGKNSYGGYVGASRFFVVRQNATDLKVWHELDSTQEMSAKADRLGMDDIEKNFWELSRLRNDIIKIIKAESRERDLMCESSAGNVVTKIEN